MPRKPCRELFEPLIQSVLDRNIPLNVENIRRLVSEKIDREVSWNTVKKYLEYLRDSGKIIEIRVGKLFLYKLR
jgi:DNA-binding transcriptional ArsR family regulator